MLWLITPHGVQIMFLADPDVDVGQPLARCLTLGKG